MPLKVKCQNCGANLKVGDGSIGKTVACPKCNQRVAVTVPLKNNYPPPPASKTTLPQGPPIARPSGTPVIISTRLATKSTSLPHIAGGIAVLMFVGTCLLLMLARVSLPSKTIDFSESLQGKWKLRTYAGRADGILSPEIDVKGYWSAEDCKERMCNLGEGQLLVISGNECRLHFTDTPFTATHFAINYAEEVYHTDRKKIVCFKNNKDNLFLTVIDNTTQEVEWRGSYWSETSYMFLENYRHDETSDLYGQWILGDLFACMKYWYDLYDKNRSPIYSKTPMKIDSKGYLPEHVGDWAGYVDGWGAEQLPGVLATERKYRAGFDSGDQSLRTITGLYAAQMPELYPPVAALKSSNAIEDPTAIGPAIAAIQQSQAGVVK